MAEVVVVGDGPGGLSAALFLAKNGHAVTVYGTDETAMHHAYLYNYLGIPEIHGSDFQRIARGQAEAHGALLVSRRVAEVARDGVRFEVTLEGGDTVHADYVVLTEGRTPELAHELGVTTDDDDQIVVDTNNRTSLPGVYVVGRSARPSRSQAIISAGAGATAALDIMALEAGKDVQDWDKPPQGRQVPNT